MFEGEPTVTEQRAFTGELPSYSATARTLAEAHHRHRDLDDGEIADYIPILAEADPAWFGLSFIDIAGRTHEAGDVDVGFSIQSNSKAFVFALVCEARSHEFVHERIGVNNTGLPLQLGDGHRTQRRAPNEFDGQCRGDRDNSTGDRRDFGIEVGDHP